MDAYRLILAGLVVVGVLGLLPTVSAGSLVCDDLRANPPDETTEVAGQKLAVSAGDTTYYVGEGPTVWQESNGLKGLQTTSITCYERTSNENGFTCRLPEEGSDLPLCQTVTYPPDTKIL